MAKQKKKVAKHSHSQNTKSSGKTTGKTTGKASEKKKKKKSKASKTEMALNSANDVAFRQQVTAEGARAIHEMEADGNCLFRSLSDQIYDDYGERHEVIRAKICNYLEKNEDFFKGFVVLDDDDENTDSDDASSFEDYVKRMREDGEWGGNPELACAAILYLLTISYCPRRNITVFTAHQAFSIDCGLKIPEGQDLMLSYHDNDHYNSVHGSSGNSQSSSEKTMAALDEANSCNSHNSDRCTKSSITSKSTIKQSTPKRNDICLCESGKKFKNCCLQKRPKFDRKAKLKRVDTTTAASTKQKSQFNVLEGDFKVLKI